MPGESLTPPQQYVQENRDDLMLLIQHGDEFIRTCALAVLIKGGDEADIEKAKRELELLQEVGDEWT